MKYIVIDVKDGDLFNEEFDSKEKAIDRADYLWDHLTDKEKKDREEFYVLESINPDEEAENHFDGNLIKTYK